MDSTASPPRVDYRTEPSQYRHWKLSAEGALARLTLDVAEDAGIRPGYKLKLNSYDLGVDIELADALNRIRFEHPQVRSVIVTSAKDRVFCSGANIFMLGVSSHAWKVNFCKFTNETRNGIEDTSKHSGLKFVAAVNGACAGGGYELALACDEIVLVDDRSSSVSLPEVPLLGVLPGTGGLTRVTDKRKVRHDLRRHLLHQRRRRSRPARGRVAPGRRDRQAGAVRRRGARARREARRDERRGLPMRRASRCRALERSESADAHPLRARHGRDRSRQAHGDDRRQGADRRAARATSPPSKRPAPSWWPLAMARQLDDAILTLRTNELELGTWILKTEGDAAAVLAAGRRAAREHRPLVRARNDRHAAPHLLLASTSRRERCSR